VNSEHENGIVTGNGARTEQALRASELSYRRLFEAAQDGILILDVDTGRINDVNPFLIKLLGFSRDEMVGKTVGEFSPFKDIVANQAMLERLQKDGYVRYDKLPLETKDGCKIAVEFVSNVYQAGEKKVIQCNIRDITEHKQVENAAIRLAAIVESSDDAIIGKDLDGKIQSWNHGAEKLLGYSAGEMMGASIMRMIPADRQDEENQILEKIRHGESVRNFETVWQAKNGRRIDVSVTVSPIKDLTGQLVGASKVARDITERKRAEETLRASQQMLGEIINALPARVFWKDKNLIYLGCNTIFARDAGFARPEDIIGRDDFQMGWWEQAEKYRGDDRQVIESGCAKLLIEELQTTPEGKTIALLSSKIPLRDSKGEIIGMIGTYLDITKRKQAEESNVRLAEIVETSDDAIVGEDLNNVVTSWNKGAEKMFGHTAGEIVGVSVLRYVPGDQREEQNQILEKIKRGENAGHFETVRQTKDGRLIEISVTASPIKDATGKVIGISKILRDITGRKQMEAALRQSEEQFRAMFDLASVGIAQADPRTGRWLRVNNKMCEITGYSVGELLQMHIPDITHPEDRQSDREAFERVVRGESPDYHIEKRYIRKDGALIWVNVNMTVVRDAAGQPTRTVAVIEDINERRKLQAQFIAAQKMEVVGQLAGGVAHDFNNIIAVIMGYGNLITADLEADSPLRKYADEIQHATERAAGLTRQLLIFSRNQTVQPVVLDLNVAVKELDKMLRRLVDEHIEMAVVLEKQNGRIKADPGYIWQVLMNLVVNARDAMPNGGKLTIATRNVTLDENYTRTHTGIIPGDYVMLTVSDSGTGMTDEVKAHIFEALFTTKPKGKGTGLGLATCRTIVQQSGGHIDVESELGKGTTFKIYFPRVDEPLDADTKFIKAGPIPRGTETLLLVEDEPSLRHLAAGVLEAQGYNVLRAANGQDALGVAQEHKGPPIRLVVTDVVMPQMGGKVMAEWLKTTYPDLKILFTSGYTDEAIARQGVQEPGVAFLPKPYTSVILARKVRAMLDNQTDSAFLRKHSVTINEIPPGSA
jgi:PAS domain S-box-containing protein